MTEPTEEDISLVEATKANDLKEVKFLVEQKNASLTGTVAHIAAEYGYFDILKYVADTNPALLDSRDPNGNIVLHLALRNDRFDMDTFKYLVEEKGAPLTRTNNLKQTPACVAAKRGLLEVIKYAADRIPFTLFRRDVDGECVLHMQDGEKVMELIKYLEEKYGYDIPMWSREDFDSSAAHVAARFGYMEVLKYVLEKREGDVNAINEKGQPIVFTAVKYRHMDVFHYLVDEKGANTTMVDEINENILFMSVHGNNFRAMSYILDVKKEDIDVDHKNAFGATILHIAAAENRKPMVEFLVEDRNASVNAVGPRMCTPLHAAANRNNWEICRYLVEHGANARAEDEDGHYPAPSTPDRRLESFLRSARLRSRRSVLPYATGEQGLQPYASGEREVSGDFTRFVGGVEETRTNDWRGIYSSQLPAFLVIANSIFSHKKGAVHHGHAVCSIEKRIDPVAADAVLGIRM